jgi:hypothetical protein
METPSHHVDCPTLPIPFLVQGIYFVGIPKNASRKRQGSHDNPRGRSNGQGHFDDIHPGELQRL